MTKSKKIIVTGGSGFIGSALVRFLIKETNYQILNFDALKYSGNAESLMSISESPRYHFINGDICDAHLVRDTLESFAPDGIFHLAAESHVDRSIDDAAPFIKTNINGTYNLLEASSEYLNSKDEDFKNNFRFLHVSTDEVYGDLNASQAPCDELKSYEPSSPYSASKASSDHLVKSWFRTFNFPALITNCSNNYGPFHFPEKLIPHIILNSLHGKKIPIYGDGQQVRDWIFVDDHVKALYLVYEHGTIGNTYNIGASNEIKNIDIANMVCQLLDKMIPIKPNNISSFKSLITFVKDRPGHDRRYAINSSKIQNELGWNPSESFESGLEKTVQWYLDNKNWWEPVLKRGYSLERLGK